jgi:hypothetical protein
MDAAEAERERFFDPSQWRRSTRGNLCRTWYGRTVTIFARYGQWRWCIASDDTIPAQFSQRGYKSIEAAQAALAGVVVEVVL